MFTVQRYHDISCGHRVYGHEGKCAHLHGHNYRIHFTCTTGTSLRHEGLDSVGRVIDFSVLKEKLCMWVEKNWDHKFLMWDQDPDLISMKIIDYDGVVPVTFNPTAENMAKYLVGTVGPEVLQREDVQLIKVTIEETAKCWAAYEVL